MDGVCLYLFLGGSSTPHSLGVSPSVSTPQAATSAVAAAAAAAAALPSLPAAAASSPAAAASSPAAAAAAAARLFAAQEGTVRREEGWSDVGGGGPQTPHACSSALDSVHDFATAFTSAPPQLTSQPAANAAAPSSVGGDDGVGGGCGGGRGHGNGNHPHPVGTATKPAEKKSLLPPLPRIPNGFPPPPLSLSSTPRHLHPTIAQPPSHASTPRHLSSLYHPSSSSSSSSGATQREEGLGGSGLNASTRCQLPPQTKPLPPPILTPAAPAATATAAAAALHAHHARGTAGPPLLVPGLVPSLNLNTLSAAAMNSRRSIQDGGGRTSSRPEAGAFDSTALG